MPTKKTPMKFETLLKKVQVEGLKRGAVIYELLNRNAGWGVFWHEEGHHRRTGLGWCESPDKKWRRDLVVYQYAPTLRKALEAELKRMEKVPVTHPEMEHRAA